MVPSQALKNSTADDVVFRRGSLTYQQVHAYGWRTEQECRSYAHGRWHSETGKRGITIRSRKLWDAASNALRISSSTEIDGSLWKVSCTTYDGLKNGEIPKPGKAHYYGHLFEAKSSLETLGYVIAPDETRAKMAAMVTLGPRAHSSSVALERVGVSDWDRVKALNRALRESYMKMIEQARMTLQHKLWEIEQAECQVSFLEVEATFDSVPMTEAK
jgi:hypothetical protein